METAVREHLTRHQAVERPWKAVWGFGEFDDATVVCSELDSPEERQHPEPWEFIYLSKYGDQDALLEALTTLHELYPNAHVGYRTGNEVLAARSDEQVAGNLVLVGGPDYNRIAQAFERYSPFRYSQAGTDNNISIKLKKDGREFTPRIRGTDPEEFVDYGFFVSRRNPHNFDKRLIMIGGCHTRGVYGAIRAFRYSRRQRDTIAQANCRTVVERLGEGAEFHALFEVTGFGSTIPTPRLDPRHLWPVR